METINNVASAAAKAVWGESDVNREPVSGAQGDVSKGEPYDAGNIDPQDQPKLGNDIESPGENPAALPADSETRHHEEKPAVAPAVAQAAKATGGTDDSSPKVKSDEATPSHGDTSHKQNDTRDPADVDEAEDEVDVSGPGPRPLEVVAAEHGGDAGRDGQPAEETKQEDTDETTEDKKNEGTGEQVVTATGFAADGGDFDATNPGAGKEADRLAEQKGQHFNEGSGASGNTGDHSGASKDKKDSGSKPSLSERIKAKLHKH